MKKRSCFFKISLLFSFILLLSSAINAQNTVTGTVTDAESSETVPGVHVVVHGTSQGTITDVDGQYSLSVPDEDSELEFSLIGYETKIVPVQGREVVDVEITSSLTELDEVVVTGYGGTQLRSKLTNSITTVDDETFTKGVHSNPAQALSGAVSGLRVSQTSGRPGAVPNIVLRGGTNLDGSGSPLVLVDGQVRNISDINPNDIESMEVLKDAGATALYGARANNGVILITTRRGSEGVSEISVSSKIGLNYLNPPYEFMNAPDYLHWARTGVQHAGNMYGENTGHGTGIQGTLNGTTPYGIGNVYFDSEGNPIDGNQTTLGVWSPMVYTDDLAFLKDRGWRTMIDPITGEEIIFNEFDMSDYAFNRPSVTEEYNVSVTGGNDRGNYYAGIGYHSDEGIPVDTYYDRLTFTFNGDYQIRDWLKSSSSFSFNDAQWKNVVNNSEANYFGRMLSLPPTMRGYNDDGEMLLGPNFGDGNPKVNSDKFERHNRSNKFTMIQGFSFDLARGLSFDVNANLMFDESHQESFNRDFLSSPGNINTSRSSSASFNRTIRQTYNAVLNYELDFGQNHHVNSLLGYEYYDTYNKGLSASGSGAPTDSFRDLSYTSSDEGMRNINSWHVRERIKSYFGRVNYDYDDKYLMTFTFRNDGYSKLLDDNQWGFFPGISGGWVASREDFMRDYSHIISFAKLRASYGLNGNVSGIGPYELQGSYNTNEYNGNIGYLTGSIPNPGLQWEKSRTFEVGADFGLFDNAINANFTYYNRLTTDKYANIPLPGSSGITSIRSNNGEFRNRGIEMEFGFRVLERGDLAWNIDANMAFNRNTIEKLPDNGLERNRQGAFEVYDPDTGDKIWVGGYQEGQRPGALYAFEAQGIFKDEDHVMEIAADRVDITSGNNGSNGVPVYGPEVYDSEAYGLPILPGDVIWRDVNGDGTISDYDMVYQGNVNPKYTGGITSNLVYRDFTLSARMDYALDFVQMDNIRPWFMGMMQGTYNSIEETADTWTPDNPTASYPRYMWADQLGKRNYARPSSMFVYDGSYLAFREISLRYDVPVERLIGNDIAALELSVTGQNLGYLTASELYSPEISSTWGATGGYGLPRTVIFGANIRF
ncbi:SusC/RagA family TonB-linked outer membrane protein [Marinilabiliaceae bacterium ANBcel2]|nr:SusC/RagA family TonB-linked outer membrane protein [Marinilabiliaceae bacterium ANBcel2]